MRFLNIFSGSNAAGPDEPTMQSGAENSFIVLLTPPDWIRQAHLLFLSRYPYFFSPTRGPKCVPPNSKELFCEKPSMCHSTKYTALPHRSNPHCPFLLTLWAFCFGRDENTERLHHESRKRTGARRVNCFGSQNNY